MPVSIPHTLNHQPHWLASVRLPARRRQLALVLGLAACMVGHAAWAVGNVVDVTLIDRATGQELPIYTHRGEYWVAGQPQSHYGVVLRNQQARRVMAVLSVDGVNAVTGETASAQQNGYVLGPWQQAQVNGWRKNLNEIAGFYFTTPQRSYAARTDRPDDVGVIGIAVFREKPRQIILQRPYPPFATNPRYPAPDGDSENNGPYGGMKSAQSSAGTEAGPMRQEHSMARTAPSAVTDSAPALGTGHGARERDQVSSTSFVRASSTPAEIIRIRYDSMAHLQARGIVPLRPRLPKPVQPNPFPADQGFVPDPPR